MNNVEAYYYTFHKCCFTHLRSCNSYTFKKCIMTLLFYQCVCRITRQARLPPPESAASIQILKCIRAIILHFIIGSDARPARPGSSSRRAHCLAWPAHCASHRSQCGGTSRSSDTRPYVRDTSANRNSDRRSSVTQYKLFI